MVCRSKAPSSFAHVTPHASAGERRHHFSSRTYVKKKCNQKILDGLVPLIQGPSEGKNYRLKSFSWSLNPKRPTILSSSTILFCLHLFFDRHLHACIHHSPCIARHAVFGTLARGKHILTGRRFAEAQQLIREGSVGRLLPRGRLLVLLCASIDCKRIDGPISFLF